MWIILLLEIVMLSIEGTRGVILAMETMQRLDYPEAGQPTKRGNPHPWSPS